MTLRFTDEQLERLRAVSPRLDIVQRSISRDNEDTAPMFTGVEEVFYGMRPPRNLGVAPNLRWVQLHSAGINHVIDQPIWETGITLTTLSGVHAVPIGEFAVGMMLTLARRFSRIVRLQERSEWPKDKWQALLGSELHGKTLGIVGYGSIGREIGRIAKLGFGMRLLVVRREGSRVASGYIERGVGDPEGRLPDEWLRPEALPDLLARSDFVVLALPLTPATQRLIGENELRAMRPGAFLINIARGGLLDENALARALREGWIAGAGLDAFNDEPLPRESALWKFENVLVSPHVSAATPHYDERAVELFGENLRRYLAGRDLLNVVDRAAGY